MTHDRRHNATDRAFWYTAGWLDGSNNTAHPRILNDFPGHYATQYCAAWDNHAEPPHLPAVFKAWLTNQTTDQGVPK